MKVTYRPEIDGLRAIAVVAVILYHTQFTILGHQPFQGGYIGVDIFFVISGYLITSIILKELVTTGSFSFKNFYERRARRILPALIFVIIISLSFGWFYLMPNSLVDFSKSILYSLGFSSNFYFHYSGQSYNAESGLLKPFLHTWSLSIEEQFYIIFPLFLYIIFKYFRKFIIYILILGFFISLGLADWGSKNHPSFNFYVLPTRGWELLSGSILAYFEIKKRCRNKNKSLNIILPFIGLLLIFHSILFFNDKMFHPSFYSLSPIIGTCLFIWYSSQDEIFTKILSTKLFVGVGLISYSLYLWHYPIFAFDRILQFTHEDIFRKINIGFLIVFLSVISFYFIERPFRSKKLKFKFIIIVILLFITLIIISNLQIIKNDGYKNRLPELFNKSLTYEPWTILNLNGKQCYENVDFCKFNETSDKKIYMIGDSHMATLSANLKKNFVEKKFQFIVSFMGDCLYFPGFNIIDSKTKKISETCNDIYFKKIKKELLNQKNSIIIFGGRFPLHLTNKLFNNQEGGVEGSTTSWQYDPVSKYDKIEDSFKNELLELSKNNKIVLIYPIPEVGWHVPRSLFNSIPKQVNLIKNYLIPKNFITTSFKVYKERTESSFRLFNSIKSKNIFRVYPHTLFCDKAIKDRCITHNKKNIFYIDDDHPSLKGAEMINELIIETIEKNIINSL